MQPHYLAYRPALLDLVSDLHSHYAGIGRELDNHLKRTTLPQPAQNEKKKTFETFTAFLLRLQHFLAEGTSRHF